uniref:Uncharacterized protein n=1 Tax=Ciona savignyi TaxID=51511 RepID=H2ZQB5_CIOSA
MALMKNQEDISNQLSSLLERTDIGSSSFVLSSVAMKCDDKLLEEFLNDKPDTNNQNLTVFIQAQLYTAAFWGFYDVTKALIQNGADVNYPNQTTLWTPLHAACFQEHEQIITLLLENGANINALDKDGRSCIDIASVSNRVWNQFTDLGCKRTPDALLIRKGLLRSDPTNNIRSTSSATMHTKTGIKLAEYTPPSSSRSNKSSAYSSSQMKAAMGDDVLAEETPSKRSGKSSRNVSNSSM